MGIELEEFSIAELAAPIENALSTGPFGSAISSKFFQDSGIPVIRGSNLSAETGVRLIDEGLVFVSSEKAKEFGRSIARRGDLVFTCWGTINQVGLIDERSKYSEYVISNKQMKFTPDSKKADSLFLYYLFSGPEKQTEILGSGIGSSVPGFNLGQLKGNRVQLPTPDVQNRIAHILGTLDDKIELNRRMNRTLEAMAQAIFKSWFVDFEPVKAKAAAKAAGASPAAIERAAMAAIAGRSIEEAIAQEGYFDDLTPSNRASLAQTAALFPDTFQISELGEIPEGWSEGKLGDIARNYRVGVNPETVPLDTPYVGLEHIEKLNFSLSDWGSASDVESQKSQFTRSDFLFGKLRPYFHKVCCPSMDGICSTDILVIRPSCPDYFGFVGCQIFQPEFVEYANVRSTGTRMPRANWKDMANFQIAVPPSILAAKLNELAIKKWMLCSSNVAQSRTLAQLRDTLLPKLLSGKLSVRAAQTKTEEALT